MTKLHQIIRMIIGRIKYGPVNFELTRIYFPTEPAHENLVLANGPDEPVQSPKGLCCMEVKLIPHVGIYER